MELININKATAEQLQAIKHIGAARAKKIIAARPYKDIYELSNVLGLGAKRMTEILSSNTITT